MKPFLKLFPKKLNVIGMVHLSALPGAPRFAGSVEKIVDKACRETEIYLNNDIDSILVENMHDVPYIQSKNFGPETTAVMSRVCCEIKKIVPKSVPLGLQILACGNKEALAVAQANNFNYIRAEGFVFSHIADEGFTDASAGELLRYRSNIGAEDVLIFTDIKKKHSAHSITADVSIAETAQTAQFFLADGVIVTGTATGQPVCHRELSQVRSVVRLPVLIGSGVTVDNFKEFRDADGFIVGSHFKKDGDWRNSIDEVRLAKFMQEIKVFREL